MDFTKLYGMVLAFLVFSTHSRVVCTEPVTIYDVLRHFSLPEGLFPKAVKDFKFDPSGRLEVHLDHPCNSMYENELHYDRNISGVIKLGVIDQLSGISAKDLFLWFGVKQIWVDVPTTGLIYFDIGVASKQFSLSSFENPKDCLTVASPNITTHKTSDGNIRYQLDGKDLGRAIL